MSYLRHNAIIAVGDASAFDAAYATGRPVPDVEAFRASLPPEWRPLLIGPITTPVNAYRTYVFAPDGSNEGWPASDQGDAFRRRFLELFSPVTIDGSNPFDVLWVEARFGGDEPDAERESEVNVTANTARILTEGRRCPAPVLDAAAELRELTARRTALKAALEELEERIATAESIAAVSALAVSSAPLAPISAFEDPAGARAAGPTAPAVLAAGDVVTALGVLEGCHVLKFGYPAAGPSQAATGAAANRRDAEDAAKDGS